MNTRPDRAGHHTTPVITISAHTLTSHLGVDGEHCINLTTTDTGDGTITFEAAVLAAEPHPGDHIIIRQVAYRSGHWALWNPDRRTGPLELRPLLRHGITVTADDLNHTFGPNWLAVVDVIRRAATLTWSESVDLATATSAHTVRAFFDARHAAGDNDCGPHVDAATSAAATAAQHGAPGAPGWHAVENTALAVAAHHLIDIGHLDPAIYNTLSAAWRSVIGPIVHTEHTSTRRHASA